MMAVAKKAVSKEWLDSLLADYRKPEDLIGECRHASTMGGHNGKAWNIYFRRAFHRQHNTGAVIGATGK